MKVLLQNVEVPDSFVENVAYTLRKLNHQVVTPAKLLGASRHRVVQAARTLLEGLYPKSWTPFERWAVYAAKTTKPDLLLWLTTSLREEVLQEVRALGVRHCMAWWGDTPANMKRLGLLAAGWDHIFLKDKATVHKFQAVGLPASLLHEACNPAWHKRNFTAIGNDIVVAGNCYGYRQYLVERLVDAGQQIALYGPAPPLWAGQAIKSIHRSKYITRLEKSRIFGEGLACLNSTALSEGDSLNCRAFEIAGSCGLQLIEDKPVVSTCFEPGSEVLTYRSIGEICEYVARARTDSDWGMSVREAGHRRAHACHTYEKRLETIFNTLGLRAAA